MSNVKMGLGLLGDTHIVFDRRRLRWSAEAAFPAGNYGPVFVKLKANPMTEDEYESLLDTKTWISSPGSEKSVQVTYHDVSLDDESLKPLFAILRSVYDLYYDPDKKTASQNIGTVTLGLWRGPEQLEEWVLEDASIEAVDFGEESYSNDPSVDIVVKWTYKTARYTDKTKKESC